MTDSMARVAPPNSLLLVLDPDTGSLPESLAGGSVVATSSSVAIGTLAEHDGETEVHLVDDAEVPDQSRLTLRWAGTIETSGRIAVITVQADVLAVIKAPSTSTVEVWTNDPEEPDLVWVRAT